MKKHKGYEYAKYVKETKQGCPSLYHIYNQTYDMNYFLVIGQKEKVKAYWEHTADNIDSDGFCFLMNGNIIIWLEKKGELDTFAHELLHAVTDTCRAKGIKLDVNNDEPSAYLMSYLFRSFYFAVK